jgi:hypothetical protein
MCPNTSDVTYRSYLGTGIVELSHLSLGDPSYHRTNACMLKQGRLQEIFQKKRCTPWRLSNRIHVSVPLELWNQIEKTREGERKVEKGHEFPFYKLEPNISVRVLDGVSRILVALTSMEKGIWETFGVSKPGNRWWIINFFLESKIPYLPADLRHLGVYQAYKKVANNSDATTLSKDKSKSMTSVVGKPGPLADIFGFLICTPLWSSDCISLFTDIRKIWCDEVIADYNSQPSRLIQEGSSQLFTASERPVGGYHARLESPNRRLSRQKLH